MGAEHAGRETKREKESRSGFLAKRKTVTVSRRRKTPENALGQEPEKRAGPLRFRINKNPDVSTGPLARPFARSLAPLTRLLALDCSLSSRPPLRSLVRSLAHSLARGKVNY